MQISVSGKGVDVGGSLQVVVSRESHRFRVDAHGNLGTHSGMVVRARAIGEDVYATADAALEKIAKQLRRYKRKLKDHHGNETKEGASQ